MVFIDLSAFDKKSAIEKNLHSHLASPTDRLLAFFIDLLILMPVSSLLSAGVLRDLKDGFFQNLSANAIYAQVALYGFLIFMTFNLLQVLFMMFWQVTPGQKFLHLRIHIFYSSSERRRLTFFQAWILACGPWLSAMAFCIPLLEVFSHPLRRTFYDRLSDTVLLSEKPGQRPPHPLESKFIQQWIHLTALFLIVIGLLQIVSFFNSMEEGTLTAQVQESCQETYQFKNLKTTKLDRALSLFLVNKKKSECLENLLESDRIFAKEPELAYLSRYLLAQDEARRKEYQKIICEKDQNSESCHWLQKKESVSSRWIAIKVLRAQAQMENLSWGAALSLLEDLSEEPPLSTDLMKSYVKAYYSYQNNKPLMKSDRVPASTAEREKINQRFKERFGVE